MADHRKMWESLEAGHGVATVDERIAVNLRHCLPEPGKSRPKGMGADFVVNEVHGRASRSCRTTRLRVVGHRRFCVYVPEEIVRAAGGSGRPVFWSGDRLPGLKGAAQKYLPSD